MASFGSHHLSFFSLFVLFLLSPQTQAREGKFLSFFSHFTTNVKEPQVVVVPHKAKPHPHPPAPAPAPTESQSPAPAESILAPEPAEPEFVDRGDGYGLYGTTSFDENNEKESFKTGYPSTRLYSNYNYNHNHNNNNNDDEVYRNNNYNNNNYHQEYYNNHRSSNYYANNFNQDGYYANDNNYYNKNAGYESKREGMSDTRFVENGKYFYDVRGGNQNYNNYKAPERGSTAEKYYNNEGNYYDKNSKYPNEFDTMEEYEKQQESHGYLP